MKQALILAIAGAAILAQGCASHATRSERSADLDKPQATIPFINMRDSILTWQADGQDGIWLQDAHKQWYYAKLFAPCTGLEFAVTLGIQNTTLNQLDRYSQIVVPGEHMGPCQLRSLVKSEPPPNGHKHAADQKPENQAAQ